jgi:2-octaprenyl-6-methoxyphenol hydroxylase
MNAAPPLDRPLHPQGLGTAGTSDSKTAEDRMPVAIVGGGPVGLSLALALQKQGIRADIFDARDAQARRQDGRALALSYGSRQTLEWLGVWQSIAATPITAIHVSQRGSFGRTLIKAADEGLPALGYVATATSVIDALEHAAGERGLVIHDHTRVDACRPAGDAAQLDCGKTTCAASLVAYAEGSIADTADRVERNYDQHAVVCSATTDTPHNHLAWERFTAHGPVALLPLGKGFAVVLTCPAEAAADVAALDDAAFLALLQERFGQRLTGVSPRKVFPLGLRYRRSAIATRQVWLGNAAQTLHPVAGQGFNLALRDVFELARTVRDAPDPGSAALLSRYAAQRRFDRRGAIGVTDALVKLFSNDFAPLRHARGLGLLALDLLPPARSFLARRMLFGARAWP